MKLSELFSSLSEGELSNLAIANDGNGSIREKDQQRVVNYTNEALLRLYSRFVLKEKELILEQIPNVYAYPIHPKYSTNYTIGEGETLEPIRYIRDQPHQPFIGDVIKFMAAFNDCHFPIPMNDESHHMSVFTPQANLIQIPCVHPGRFLSFTYQARHPKVINDMDAWIELPDVLMGALTAYIAYKVYSHMGTADSTAKAQEHMALYENVCADAVDKDLINATVSTNNLKFSKRGWR